MRNVKTLKPAPSLALTFALATLALSAGCALVDHPTTPNLAPAASSSSWEEAFAKPAVIEHEVVVSARWRVPLSGVLDLEHPKAKAAGKTDAPMDIVLPVHVLRHPEHGVFIVDTGVTDPVVSLGLAELAFDDPIEVVDPIEAILAREKLPFGGALITHCHLDHVLGIPGLPEGAPIYVGPGELEASSLQNAATRSVYNEIVEGRGAFKQWRVEDAQPMGPVKRAIDVFGDGSLWALHMPGHTPGSMAFVAVTTRGPMLFTGDTSHTQWGFDHGVTPGSYTADHAANADSLHQLVELKAAFPDLKVFVGHEL